METADWVEVKQKDGNGRRGIAIAIRCIASGAGGSDVKPRQLGEIWG